MASKGLRRGAAATAAARAAAVVAKAAISRGGDSARSDCLIEVADVEQVVPGSLEESWASKVKVTLQQAFRRFGPVLDVRVPTREAQPIVSIRFANPKAAEAAMVAATQGFLPVAGSEVRLCQPMSKEAIWRSFPVRRVPAGVEPKKKKLRPNERFAPPRAPVVEEEAAPPKAEAAPKPKATAHQQSNKAPDPPLQHLPPAPERPSPAEAGVDASEEDVLVCAGEAQVAKEMSELLGQPISKQKKALKKIRLLWHPDKNPDTAAVATRVFQFVQAHDAWLAHHGL
ncbi:unnamed protein product [Effrenium voratum]|nr:unnamed protein product [Effrenium voratum]